MQPISATGKVIPYTIHAPVLVLAFFVAGCSTVLMNVPTAQKADGWTISVLEVTDGPNWYSRGSITYRPGSGERFLWVTATFRNEAPLARNFSYDACDLDGGELAYVPVIVDRALFATAPADGVEPYRTGEERKRRLAFSYPDGRWPSRLRCGNTSFPFPRPR